MDASGHPPTLSHCSTPVSTPLRSLTGGGCWGGAGAAGRRVGVGGRLGGSCRGLAPTRRRKQAGRQAAARAHHGAVVQLLSGHSAVVDGALRSVLQHTGAGMGANQEGSGPGVSRRRRRTAHSVARAAPLLSVPGAGAPRAWPSRRARAPCGRTSGYHPALWRVWMYGERVVAGRAAAGTQNLLLFIFTEILLSAHLAGRLDGYRGACFCRRARQQKRVSRAPAPGRTSGGDDRLHLISLRRRPPSTTISGSAGAPSMAKWGSGAFRRGGWIGWRMRCAPIDVWDCWEWCWSRM